MQFWQLIELAGRGGEKMYLYKWTGKDRFGNTTRGTMYAADKKKVGFYIQKNIGYVTGIERIYSWRERLSFFEAAHANKGERAIFFRELATLLKSGLTLIKSLELMKDRNNEHMANICLKVINVLNKGNSLSEALKRLPEDFSFTSAQIIAAGEECGQLEEVLVELADYYEGEVALKQFLKKTAITPSLVILAALSTLVLYVLKVLPTFVGLYENLDIELSPSLTLLLGVCRSIDTYMGLWASVFLFCFVIIYKKRGKIKENLQHIPFIDQCLHELMESRYCKILAMLLRSGVALPLALVTAADTLNNKSLKAAAVFMSKDVIKGIDLSQAAAMKSELFSPVTIEFINVGENSGNLAEMLAKASKILERKLQNHLDNLKEMLFPALTLFLAFFIGLIILTVMSPMFSLISNMPEYN